MKLRIKKLATFFLLANIYLLVINCSSNQGSSHSSTDDKIDIAAKCKEACEGYQNALHATPFSDADLRRSYEDVKTLAQDERAANDSQISHIMQLHELYTKISSFIAGDHAITAEFDTYHEKWDSFVKKQDIVLRQARELRSDSLYGELSHLPGFQNGLDETELKNVTNGYREAFYNDLSDQIVAHFNSKERTQSNYNLLYQIYRNFLYEEMNHGADNIANCLRQWKIDLEGN